MSQIWWIKCKGCGFIYEYPRYIVCPRCNDGRWHIRTEEKNDMTKEQEEHLQSIKDRFNTLVDAKYRKGQAEHGGDLIDKDIKFLVDAALEEAIDGVVYLLTVKQQLEEIDKFRMTHLP